MLDFLKSKSLDTGVEEYQATDGAVLLDVRTADEYRAGHVPGSINIDVAEISKAPSVISDKQTPLFVYCLSGGRSGMAVDALKKMGYTSVKNIGGINSYSGPIEKGN